jgi:hypothetical protein
MCVPAKTHEAEQSASPKVPSHTTTMITALSHLDRNDDMLHCMQRRFVLRTPMPLWKRPSQQPTSLWCSKRHLAYHSQPRTRCLSQGLVPVCVLALRDRLSQWLQLQPCIPFCHASLKIHGYAGWHGSTRCKRRQGLSMLTSAPYRSSIDDIVQHRNSHTAL